MQENKTAGRSSALLTAAPLPTLLVFAAPITAIFCNGKQSYDCYNRYIFPTLPREASVLPSTSPANAAWSIERLVDAWRVICTV